MRPATPALAMLLLLAGAAGAVQTLPPCTPPACVLAHFAAYAPAATVVRAGEPLAWGSVDILHTSTEGAPGEAARPCLDLFYGRGGVSAPASFSFGAGGLQADAEGRRMACATAEAFPGGAVVSYFCRLHPWMQGALLVLDG